MTRPIDAVEISGGGSRDRIRHRAQEIWRRARINAFAHREARERYKREAAGSYKWEIGLSILSILFIILLYVLGQNGPGSDSFWTKLTSIFLTLASITSSLAAMYVSIMSNYHKFELLSEEHKFLTNSYLHLAQKARVVEWPDLREDEASYVLRFLEESFQLLKARGSEPDNEDFHRAHVLMKEIEGDPQALAARSFHDVAPLEARDLTKTVAAIEEKAEGKDGAALPKTKEIAQKS